MSSRSKRRERYTFEQFGVERATAPEKREPYPETYTDGTCDVCNRQRPVILICSRFGPASFAYCKECEGHGAEPYGLREFFGPDQVVYVQCQYVKVKELGT